MSDHYRAPAWVKDKEDLRWLVDRTVFSNFAGMIQRKGKPIQLVLAWLLELPEGHAVH